MKTKKITFLVASLLCLGLGVGGALALNYSSAHKDHTETTDGAIYLYWGSGSKTVDIADVTELQTNVSQYRYFACEPSTSASVTGTVTLTYTIFGKTEAEKSYSLEGLKVKVYKTATLQDNEHRDLAGLEPELVLNYDVENERTGTTQFSVGGENAGRAYYCLEFVYDGSQAADQWGGQMTISQAFAA